MPIWKITKEGPEKVVETQLKEEHLLEEHLEDWLMANPDLLGEWLLIIGRQVMIPDVHDRIDILAVDAQGNAVIIELKRGALTDPVDMQALRYASYVAKWRYGDFETQAQLHLDKEDGSFNFNEIYEQFCAGAGVDEAPDLNVDQRIIVVGAEVRDKLGSVALWLREHNVDIKVIQLEVYREGEMLFLEPHTIIPLPVSRFSDTGRGKGIEGAQPWIEDGRGWHLDRRCSPTTRTMMLRLNELLLEHLDVDGPHWGQKHYVAYRVDNYNWLVVETRATMLTVHLKVKAGSLDQAAIAAELGIEVFVKDQSLADKLALSSSVFLESESQEIDHILLRLKKDFDLDREALPQFLQKAYRLCPK